MALNEFSHVTDEFLKQNSKHTKTKKPVKKGGPYTRGEKEKRRDEVYRLHFEYCYSARKIAEMMKVSRNTINGDIDFWYSKMINRRDMFEPEYHIITTLERMQAQLARLREKLDKSKSVSEQISIERLIYDVNSKVLYTWQKLATSSTRVHKMAVQWYNDILKKKDMSERSISFNEYIGVSEKTYEKIQKMIEEDRKNRFKIDLPKETLDEIDVPSSMK